MKPMMKGRLMFPSAWLQAEDLRGQDVTVTIDQVRAETLRTQDGTKEAKYTISFKGKKKRLVLNKTNACAIAAALGKSDASQWVGSKVTLYPTTCKAFGETVTCVRIRTKSSDRATDDFDDDVDPEELLDQGDDFVDGPNPPAPESVPDDIDAQMLSDQEAAYREQFDACTTAAQVQKLAGNLDAEMEPEDRPQFDPLLSTLTAEYTAKFEPTQRRDKKHRGQGSLLDQEGK